MTTIPRTRLGPRAGLAVVFVLLLVGGGQGQEAPAACSSPSAPFLNSSASGFSAGGVFNIQLFSPAASSVLGVDFGAVTGNFSVSPVDECTEQVAIRANWATLAPTLSRNETATHVTFSGLLAVALRNPSCEFNPRDHHVPANVPVCIKSKEGSSSSGSSKSSDSKKSKNLLLTGGGGEDSSSDEESSNICGGSSSSSSSSSSGSKSSSSSGNHLLTGGSYGSSSSSSRSSSSSDSSDDSDCEVPPGPGNAGLDIVNASCVLGHACFVVENKGPNDMICATQYRIKVGGDLARSGGLFLRLGQQTQLCFPVDQQVAVTLEVDLPPGYLDDGASHDDGKSSSGGDKSKKKKKNSKNDDGSAVAHDLVSFTLQAGCAPDPCLTPTYVFPFDVTFPRNIESDITDLLTLSPVGQIAALVKQSVVVDVNTATAEASVDLEVLLDYPYLPLFTENSTLQVTTNRSGLPAGIGVQVLYTCDDPDPHAAGVNETFCRFKFRFAMTPDGVCEIDGVYDLKFIVVCSPRYLAAGGRCDLLTSADNVVNIRFLLDSEHFCSQVVDSVDVRASLTGWKTLEDALQLQPQGGGGQHDVFPRSNFLSGNTAYFRVGVTGDVTPTHTRLTRLVVRFANGTEANAVDNGLKTGLLPDLKLIPAPDSTSETYFSFRFANPPFSVPSDGSTGFSFKAYVNLDFGSAAGAPLLLAAAPPRPLKGVPALMDLAVFRVRALVSDPTIVTIPKAPLAAAAAVRDSLLIGLVSGAVAIGAFTFIYLSCCSTWRQQKGKAASSTPSGKMPIVPISAASKRRSFRDSWRELRQRRRDRKQQRSSRSRSRRSGGRSSRREESSSSAAGGGARSSSRQQGRGDRNRDLERDSSSRRRDKSAGGSRDPRRQSSSSAAGGVSSSAVATAASTRKAPPRLSHRRSSSLALPKQGGGRSDGEQRDSRHRQKHLRTPSADVYDRQQQQQRQHVRRSSRGSAVSSGGRSRRRRSRSRSRSPPAVAMSVRSRRQERDQRSGQPQQQQQQQRDNSPSRGSAGSGHSGLSRHSHASSAASRVSRASRGSSRNSATLSGHRSDAASTVLADYETASSSGALGYNPAAHRAGDPMHRALPSGPYQRVQHPMEPIPMRTAPPPPSSTGSGAYDMVHLASSPRYDDRAQQNELRQHQHQQHPQLVQPGAHEHRRAASDQSSNVNFFDLARMTGGLKPPAAAAAGGANGAPAVALRAPPMPAIVPEHKVYATDSPLQRPVPLGRILGF